MLAYGMYLRKNNEQYKLKYDSLSCPPFVLSTLQVSRSIWIGVVVTQAKNVCRDISFQSLVIETRQLCQSAISNHEGECGISRHND
jgi:hypothetical protein